MRVQRCHSRPARPAHRALLETCALHRASLHCAASPCGSPSLLSLPAASGQREGSQSACAVLLVACHCLPISRVLAVDRSTFPWLCCKPRLAAASPRPHLSYLAASHSACAAACSALRVRPAAATHLRIPVTLSASLCADVILPICGDLWAPSLRLPCSRNSFKASVTASRAAEAAVVWGTLDDCFAACELPQQHQLGTLCEPILRKTVIQGPSQTRITN